MDYVLKENYIIATFSLSVDQDEGLIALFTEILCCAFGVWLAKHGYMH